MVMMAKKSPIADRLDRELGAEFELHKSDETTYGSGSDLPAGINGGVAQLVEAKIDEYKEGDNKGKLYIYLAGVVKSPEETKDGVKIAGLRAQKTVKLFANNRDTKEQAVAKGLNEVRKMGGITATIKPRDLPTLLDALKAEAPHFRFRTYSFTPDGSEEAMIVTEFRGKCDYESNGSTGGVVDATGTPTDAGQTAGSDEEDWDAVLEAATTNDDGAAQTKLKDTCMAMGMTAQQVEDASSWEDLASFIKGSGAGGGSAGTDSSAWKPEEGDEVSVKLKGMKSAQKLKVVKVFKTTVHLINEATKKEYKGIEWADNPPRLDGVEI